MRSLTVLAAALATTAFTGTANAAITVYTTQASFAAATNSAGVDTFNDLSPVVAVPAPQTRTAGAYTYSATGTGGLYAVGTAADPWLSNNNYLGSVTFSNFSAGVSAVGGLFFGNNSAGAFVAAPLGLMITATDASGTSTQTLLNPTTTSFLGFVSTGAISQLTVSANGTLIYPTINNLTLAKAGAAVTTAVPEPTTWAMMIGGFAFAGAAMRRRTTKVAFAAA